MTPRTVSRRTFLAISATLPFALRTRAASSIPVGLELYSVRDRKSTRLNSSHSQISYAVFCLKKKKTNQDRTDSHSNSGHGGSQEPRPLRFDPLQRWELLSARQHTHHPQATSSS